MTSINSRDGKAYGVQRFSDISSRSHLFAKVECESYRLFLLELNTTWVHEFAALCQIGL
jgi:hypothetical protein